MSSQFCYGCGVELGENNRFPCDIKRHQLICKQCRYKQNRIWLTSHPEYTRQRRLERRQTTIRYHDLFLRGQKRDHPIDDKCELCQRQSRNLAYHHYYDFDLTKGMWLCAACHVFAEWVDRGYLLNYLRLKEQVIGVKYKWTFENDHLIKEILGDSASQKEVERVTKEILSVVKAEA